MNIKVVVFSVVLAVYCIVSGCNCPCDSKTACTMPQKSASGDMASEMAVN